MKGGPNSGVFLQITYDDSVELPVPGQKYTFGIVKAAQARGDFQVLADRGRRALRVHLGRNLKAGSATLQAAVQKRLSEVRLFRMRGRNGLGTPALLGAAHMQLGMVGLGRMGANMTRRLMRGGHQLVVSDLSPDSVEATSRRRRGWVDIARRYDSQAQPPRAVWIMVPAGAATESTVQKVAAHLQAGDTIIDGGNSYFKDDVRRANELKAKASTTSTSAPAAACGDWNAVTA